MQVDGLGAGPVVGVGVQPATHDVASPTRPRRPSPFTTRPTALRCSAWTPWNGCHAASPTSWPEGRTFPRLPARPRSGVPAPRAGWRKPAAFSHPARRGRATTTGRGCSLPGPRSCWPGRPPAPPEPTTTPPQAARLFEGTGDVLAAGDRPRGRGARRRPRRAVGQALDDAVHALVAFGSPSDGERDPAGEAVLTELLGPAVPAVLRP